MQGILSLIVVVAIVASVESFAPFASRVAVRTSLKAATDGALSWSCKADSKSKTDEGILWAVNCCSTDTSIIIIAEIPITAKMVSQLRAKTDSPMMECKKALIEAKGDFDRAEEILRVKLGNKATKVGSRIAAEGTIVSFYFNIQHRVSYFVAHFLPLLSHHKGLVIAMIDGDQGVLFEANCETDFVSKNPDFIEFTKTVAGIIVKESPADVTALSAMPMEGKTVEAIRSDLVGKIGENMSIRRFQRFGSGAKLASYVHGTRIGTYTPPLVSKLLITLSFELALIFYRCVWIEESTM